MRYILTKSAEEDLKSIAQYGLEKYGIKQAYLYKDRLKKQVEILADNPFLYRQRLEFQQVF